MSGRYLASLHCRSVPTSTADVLRPTLAPIPTSVGLSFLHFQTPEKHIDMQTALEPMACHATSRTDRWPPGPRIALGLIPTELVRFVKRILDSRGYEGTPMDGFGAHTLSQLAPGVGLVIRHMERQTDRFGAVLQATQLHDPTQQARHPYRLSFGGYSKSAKYLTQVLVSAWTEDNRS